MSVLTREQLAAQKPKRKTVEVEVEELGGAVRLRGMSAGEALEFRKQALKLEKEGGDANIELAPGLVADAWVDGDDQPMWEDRAKGIEYVLSLSPTGYNALAKAILELTGYTEEAIAEAEKN
jgi:hypothetical protein